MTNRYRTADLAALAMAVLLASVAAPAAAEDPANSPLLVKIHADWCGTCTRLNPTWDALQAKYGDSVQLVVLDVTDKEALVRSTAEADRLGIREFFDDYKSKTGTIGVLNGSNGEVVRVLKGETDATAYEAPLAHAAGQTPS